MEKFPHEFLCPITHELFNEPVSTADGQTYEKTAIEEWLKKHDTSPLTGARLEHKFLIPNLALKKLIGAHLEKYPELESKKQEELFQAAKEGNLAKLKKTLEKGASISAMNENGFNVLHLACQHNQLEVAKFLLENKAEVESKVVFKPLDKEIKELTNQVNLLFAEKQNKLEKVNSKERYQYQTETQKVENKFQPKINEFNEKISKLRKEETSRKQLEGQTTLHLAAANNFLELAKLLIEFGADLDATDQKGRTPLEIAVTTYQTNAIKNQTTCIYPCKEVASFLILAGADCLLNEGNHVWLYGADEEMRKALRLARKERKKQKKAKLLQLENQVQALTKKLQELSSK